MYEEYLEFAVGLARQAGTIQMESFRGGDLGGGKKKTFPAPVAYLLLKNFLILWL